jgi:hypothetical protein
MTNFMIPADFSIFTIGAIFLGAILLVALLSRAAWRVTDKDRKT